MRRCVAIALASAGAGALLASPAADAATVAGRGLPGTYEAELAFVAAPGERNRVVLRYTYGTAPPADSFWTVVDTGAVLVPGESCQAVDAHTVRCLPLTSVRVELGDMDDRLLAKEAGDSPMTANGGGGRDRIVGSDGGNQLSGGPGDDKLSAGSGGLTGDNHLDGGPGNDRLVGGNAYDELHGGGGVDELKGGRRADVLFDDDVDGAVGEGAPGPDRLDGGLGFDRVSYARRTAPVFVDLADRSTDGEDGEGDHLTNVEAVIGGRGNDRLAGDNHHNALDGQRGRDQLAGRGGADELERAEGAVSCGRGLDTYFGGGSWRDFLKPDCEVLAPAYDATISANPEGASGRAVRFRVRCPPTYDEETDGPVVGRCGPGPLRLREASGRRRTLARGHLPAGAWKGRPVRARLTALGQQLATRPHGVRARVRLAGYYPDGPPLRWTIRLKVPR